MGEGKKQFKKNVTLPGPEQDHKNNPKKYLTCGAKKFKSKKKGPPQFYLDFPSLGGETQGPPPPRAEKVRQPQLNPLKGGRSFRPPLYNKKPPVRPRLCVSFPPRSFSSPAAITLSRRSRSSRRRHIETKARPFLCAIPPIPLPPPPHLKKSKHPNPTRTQPYPLTLIKQSCFSKKKGNPPRPKKKKNKKKKGDLPSPPAANKNKSLGLRPTAHPNGGGLRAKKGTGVIEPGDFFLFFFFFL